MVLTSPLPPALRSHTREKTSPARRAGLVYLPIRLLDLYLVQDLCARAPGKPDTSPRHHQHTRPEFDIDRHIIANLDALVPQTRPDVKTPYP
jgi:hypothetical protein